MTTDNQQTPTGEGGFLTGVHQDWQADRAKEAVSQLTSLVDPERYVGDLISLEYGIANILIHDYHKGVVGGIPHGCLLLATRITPDEPEIPDPAYERMALILLRVIGGTPLRSDIDVERARLEAVKRANDTAKNYDESAHTDQFTLDLLRYAGAKCRVLGTFRMYQEDASNDEWQLHFGGDLDSFYAGQGMKIYKPHGDALRRIVNYRSSDEESAKPTQIGRLRYSAAVKDITPESVGVEIVADDMVAQRTALFGMTRSGKSNTTKKIAAAIFKLRSEQDEQRVGQLIFDPNGEYANDNPQDQGCLRNIQYEGEGAVGEVQTYGSYEHPHDPDRHITKFNFYGSQEPPSLSPDMEQMWTGLEPLYQGKQIINDALSDETGGYILAFIAADVLGGDTVPSDHGDYKRLRRRLFLHRAILAEAGFETPSWPADARGLFKKDLRDLMQDEPTLTQYVHHLESGVMSWDLAGNFSRAFADWVNKDTFKTYDTQYAQSKPDGRKWSDTHLLGLLRIYDNTRGISVMQRTRVWHDLSSTDDYAATIVKQVRDGNLVIVDQLLGEEKMNRQAAERICRSLFEAQQRSFISPKIDEVTDTVLSPPPVVVYAEEAHTLLPESGENDSGNIWARLAKEGAKFNIGMVYSTQEPSSIQRNILTNTENWFIAHLSSTDETNQIRKYKDFSDFTESLVNASEPGFLRVRTRSRHFTVPVQMDLFQAIPPQPVSSESNGEEQDGLA